MPSDPIERNTGCAETSDAPTPRVWPHPPMPPLVAVVYLVATLKPGPQPHNAGVTPARYLETVRCTEAIRATLTADPALVAQVDGGGE